MATRSKGKNQGRMLAIKIPLQEGPRSNADRAALAEHLLFAYDDITNEMPSVDSITDVLTDLMHYCQTNDTELTFDECLERARGHFDVEQAEEKEN